jgi:hypothetical protein
LKPKTIIYNPYKIKIENGSRCLDPWCSHFLLIDSGNPQPVLVGDRSALRDELESKITNYLKIPIIRIIIGTDSNKLFSIRSAARNDIPCLFIEVKTFFYNLSF